MRVLFKMFISSAAVFVLMASMQAGAGKLSQTKNENSANTCQSQCVRHKDKDPEAYETCLMECKKAKGNDQTLQIKPVKK